jgi:ABC-type glycerol-3-phosphate transport system substrate-binding protein
MRHMHRSARLAAALGLAALVAACSSLTPGSTNSTSSSSAPAATSSAGSSAAGSAASAGPSGAASPSGAATAASSAAVATAVPSDNIELKLAFTDSPDMTKALVDAFHTKYPNVTIKTQYTQFNDYVKSLKLTMSSATPPDIVQYNAALKDLSAAGLIKDLTPYEQAYGWDSSFPKSALDMLRVDSTGKILGTGKLIAVPGGLSLVGLYYNKTLMKKAGITTPPATLAEFEADLAKAKTAGVTGLSLGALDTGGLHLWGSLLDVLMDPQAQRNWVNGKAGSSISTPAAVQATEKVGEYASKGYFPASANGTSENDSATAFAQGKAMFHINGNWAASQLAKALGDQVGFSVMPPATAGGKAVGNGFSVSYAVSAKTKHAEAVTAFLNFLQSPEATKIEAEGGFLPPNAKAAPAATGVLGDLVKANQQVVGADGLIPFQDFAAPSMLDSLESGLQSVIGGKQKPQAFLDSLQSVWTEYHS